MADKVVAPWTPTRIILKLGHRHIILKLEHRYIFTVGEAVRSTCGKSHG